MAGYTLILGIILIFGCIAMIVSPREVWRFSSGWRFTHPDDVQLSAAYKAWLRLSGAVGLAMGIVLLVYSFR
jgi:uncharacterized membrane protein HdeD (DUF308 family)